jgi:hypothetical protein
MLPVLAVLSQTILFGNLAIFPNSIEPNHGSRVVETGIAAAFLVLIPLMLYVV